MKKLRVLIGCEYSGRVRDAFLRRGHDAISCDLLPSDTPGPHYQGDVRDILADRWDLIVAHPPCTYLTCAAEWAYGPGPYHQKVKPDTLTGAARLAARAEAVAFVKQLLAAPCQRFCVENPVGVLSRHIGRPAQIVQPYDFGEDASKATSLWTRGLPLLTPTERFPPRLVFGRPRWGNQTDSGQNRLSPGVDRWKVRSITYQGIANAMADQWGNL